MSDAKANLGPPFKPFVAVEPGAYGGPEQKIFWHSISAMPEFRNYSFEVSFTFLGGTVVTWNNLCYLKHFADGFLGVANCGLQSVPLIYFHLYNHHLLFKSV